MGHFRHAIAALLCRARIYRALSVPPGGCFASALAEFDGKAPGQVRDRIAECQHEWMNTLERAAQDARARRTAEASATGGAGRRKGGSK